MADKTEEEIARDKAAVDAMRRAKAVMELTLSRNRTLENALEQAIAAMRDHKKYVPENAHLYSASGKSLHVTIDGHIAAALAALG